MAKKKESQSPQPKVEEVKPEPSSAEIFARQRRIKVLPRQEGEALMDALVKAGIRMASRGDAERTMVTIQGGRYVIDLTK